MELFDPNDKFLRALILYKLNTNEYREVYRLLEEGNFCSTEGLLELWDEAHYREKKSHIGKELTPLIKYRIRQKFPPPANILPGGKRPSAKLPPEAVSLLKAWLQEHAASPYPTKQDKDILVKKSNLTMYQVKTWFANARRRMRSTKPVLPKNNYVRSDISSSSMGSTEPFPFSRNNFLKTDNSVLSRSDCMNLKPDKSNVVQRDDYTRATDVVPLPKSDCIRLSGPLPWSRNDCMRSTNSLPASRDACMRSTNSLPSSRNDYMSSTSPGVSIPSNILPPDSPVELNASRSLQALAGMCDEIQQYSIYQQPYNYNVRNPANQNLYYSNIDVSNSVQNTPMASPVDQNCSKPKEFTLWQPFKSTENLTLLDHSGNAIQRTHCRSQYTNTSHCQNNHKNNNPIKHVAYQQAPMYFPLLEDQAVTLRSQHNEHVLPASEHGQPRFVYPPASFPNLYRFTIPQQAPGFNPRTIPLHLPFDPLPREAGFQCENLFQSIPMTNTRDLAETIRHDSFPLGLNLLANTAIHIKEQYRQTLEERLTNKDRARCQAGDSTEVGLVQGLTNGVTSPKQ